MKPVYNLMKNLILYISLSTLLLSCSNLRESDPPSPAMKTMEVVQVTMRYRAPWDCPSNDRVIYDTVDVGVVKNWYNQTARDTMVPQEHWWRAWHREPPTNRFPCYLPNTKIRYALFLIDRHTIEIPAEKSVNKKETFVLFEQCPY